jgi:hypothetical protein
MRTSQNSSLWRCESSMSFAIEIKGVIGGKRMFGRSREDRMCNLFGPSLTLRVVIGSELRCLQFTSRRDQQPWNQLHRHPRSRLR